MVYGIWFRVWGLGFALHPITYTSIQCILKTHNVCVCVCVCVCVIECIYEQIHTKNYAIHPHAIPNTLHQYFFLIHTKNYAIHPHALPNTLHQYFFFYIPRIMPYTHTLYRTRSITQVSVMPPPRWRLCMCVCVCVWCVCVCVCKLSSVETLCKTHVSSSSHVSHIAHMLGP